MRSSLCFVWLVCTCLAPVDAGAKKHAGFVRVFQQPGLSIQGLAIKEAKSGGFWVVGNEGATMLGLAGKLLVLRLNAKGKRIWQRRYPIVVYNHAWIFLRPRGVVIVAGLQVVMIGQKGKLLWKTRCFKAGAGRLVAATRMVGGALALGGYRRVGLHHRKLWVAAFDVGHRRFLWQRTWDLEQWTMLYALMPLAKGGLLGVGWTRKPSVGRGLVMRLGPRGKKKWHRFLPQPKGQLYQTALAVAHDGKGFVVATNRYGYFGRGYTGDGKATLFAVSSKGSVKQLRQMRGSGVYARLWLYPTNKGLVMLHDEATYAGVEGRGAPILRMWDNKGKERWKKTFRWGRSSRGYSLQRTRDGGFVWTGWGVPKHTHHKVLMVTKVTTKGKLQ